MLRVCDVSASPDMLNSALEACCGILINLEKIRAGVSSVSAADAATRSQIGQAIELMRAVIHRLRLATEHPTGSEISFVVSGPARGGRH